MIAPAIGMTLRPLMAQIRKLLEEWERRLDARFGESDLFLAEWDRRFESARADLRRALLK